MTGELKTMNICILGSGRVGGTLAKRWANIGHTISLVVRDKTSPKATELAKDTRGTLFDNSELVKAFSGSKVIVNALPWLEVEKIFKPFADSLAGKIILDTTNPIKLGADEVKDGLLIGHETSAGEQVKIFAPEAIVVKGLNTVGWEIMENPGLIPHQPVAFICGDDDGKSIVSTLIWELGLRPSDVGSLKEARLTEPLGFLWIHLCFARQWGPEFVINPVKSQRLQPDKQTIVLLHGAFQDSSCWKKVKLVLEQRGYKTLTPELPGRNGDGIDPKSLNLETYRDVVLKIISSETNPVVLVGHSFGGITISAVAEANPEKIKALVYLSAYLPKDGQSLMSLASTDKDSHLAKPGNLVLSADYSVASIKEEQKAKIFANDAKGEDQDAIVKSLISEPGIPQGVPVHLTRARFGCVPKFYIETTNDNCISPYLQEQMLSNTQLVKVRKIDAGHASYVTAPEQVAEAILEAAAY